MTVTRLLLIGGLWLGAMGLGCDRDDAITTYRVPRETPSTAPATDGMANGAGAPGAAGNAMAGAMPPPTLAPASALAWTLPAGWKQVPAGQMRFAAFQVSANDPGLLVTVIPMPAGQEILPNINRWEGQLGLTPSTPQQVKEKITTIDASGTPVQTIELIGAEKPGEPASSMLAAFADKGSYTWFFKLMGPASAVAEQKPAFVAFLKSLRFAETPGVTPGIANAPAPTAPASTIPAPSAESDHPGVQWTVPATWLAQPPKPMRLASWRTRADEQGADVIVSSFQAGGFGDVLSNVNRWRGMAKLPPVTDLKDVQSQELAIGPAKATVYDFAGTGEGAQRVRVVQVPGADGKVVYFFRLQGSATSVGTAQKDFDSFIQSIQLSQ